MKCQHCKWPMYAARPHVESFQPPNLDRTGCPTGMVVLAIYCQNCGIRHITDPFPMPLVVLHGTSPRDEDAAQRYVK